MIEEKRKLRSIFYEKLSFVQCERKYSNSDELNWLEFLHLFHYAIDLINGTW